MAADARGREVRTVRHGFPPVPGDVTQAHVLRRYLQGLRDALQNYRWLFDGLGDLTSTQQARLITALVGLAGVQKQNQQQQATLDEQALTLVVLQDDLTALEQRVTAAELRLDALDLWKATVDSDIAQVKLDITNIQDNCCP